MKKKNFKILVGCVLMFIVILYLFVMPSIVRAEGTGWEDLLNFDFGLSPEDANLEGKVIDNANYVIGLTGLISLAFFVFGAIQFITAGGEESKVQKAVATIRNAIIGLILVLLSGVIFNFVINRITAEESKLLNPNHNFNLVNV